MATLRKLPTINPGDFNAEEVYDWMRQELANYSNYLELVNERASHIERLNELEGRIATKRLISALASLALAKPLKTINN